MQSNFNRKTFQTYIANAINRKLEKYKDFDVKGLLFIFGTVIALIVVLIGSSILVTIAPQFVTSILAACMLVILTVVVIRYCQAALNSFHKFFVILLIYACIALQFAYFSIKKSDDLFDNKEILPFWVAFIIIYLVTLCVACLSANYEVASLSIYCLNVIVTIITAVANLIILCRTEAQIIQDFSITAEVLKTTTDLGFNAKEMIQIGINFIVLPVLCVGVFAELVLKCYEYWKKCKKLNSK